MKVPPYVRSDAFVVSHRELPAPEEDEAEDRGSGSVSVEVQITSPHGPRCPMPMLDHVLFSFPVSALLQGRSTHLSVNQTH
jgi:hypothetical protein